MEYIQKVDNLIALVKIFNEYETFMEELNVLQQETKLDWHDITYAIDRIKQKNKLVGKKKIKEFYTKNKEIIDKIYECTTMYDFVNQSLYYSYENESIDMEYFYSYINEHKKDLNKIEELLKRLDLLDVDVLKMNEDVDLSKKTYSMQYTVYNRAYDIYFYNTSIAYLANMEILPNYEKDVLKYKTNNSPYELKLKLNSFSKNEIIVNDLLFDLALLPEQPINVEEFASEMISKKESKKNDYILFRESIVMDLYTAEISKYIGYIDNKIDEIDDIKSKKELKNVLLQMQEKLKLFEKKTGEYYANEICDSIFLDKGIKQKELELEHSRRNSDCL